MTIPPSSLRRAAFLSCALVALQSLPSTAATAVHARLPATNATPAAPFAFDEADIAGLQARMAAGSLDSVTLTRAYLERIATVDAAGPALNSVIELNPDALKDAAALDAERIAGKTRGPLHGIPILLKDNIDATPMVNSGGSLALADHRPSSDAFLVQRLRAAGAVILGKTNLSEWANFRSSRSTSGWSGRGGQTKNPYALDRNPCGSSAGTGTAIAANLATVGVGTETDGSVICPSSVAGLVGIKPTVGLVSRSGIIPISHSQDTAGPMTRSVADAAALLGVMAAPDDADKTSLQASRPAAVDYLAHLKPDALKGARIGVLKKHGVNPQPDVDAAFARTLDVLKAAGATLVDTEIATTGKWDDDEFQVLLYEFKTDLESYLRGSKAPIQTLAGLIAFNETNATREMPWFGQELFVQAQAKGPLTDKAYITARDKARRLAGPEGIVAALDRQKLDALIAPATGPAWPTDLVNADHFTGGSYGAAAVAGTPSITVPMGDSHGLPFGLIFMGRAWSEPRLIELAYAFEQKTHARKAPEFLPTVRMEDARSK